MQISMDSAKARIRGGLHPKGISHPSENRNKSGTTQRAVPTLAYHHTINRKQAKLEHYFI